MSNESVKPTAVPTPRENQIVLVEGGVARYHDGVFYTAMEDPWWERPIQWDVEAWLPTHGIAKMRRAVNAHEALLEASKRAMYKLNAYVGVCAGDKELPKVIGLLEAAIKLAEEQS